MKIIIPIFAAAIVLAGVALFAVNNAQRTLASDSTTSSVAEVTTPAQTKKAATTTAVTTEETQDELAGVGVDGSKNPISSNEGAIDHTGNMDQKLLDGFIKHGWLNEDGTPAKELAGWEKDALIAAGYSFDGNSVEPVVTAPVVTTAPVTTQQGQTTAQPAQTEQQKKNVDLGGLTPEQYQAMLDAADDLGAVEGSGENGEQREFSEEELKKMDQGSGGYK